MSVAIIADSHLGGPGGDGDELVEQLRALPEQGCTHLILLGDIFHVWVGSEKFETPEVRKIVPEFRRLRDAGLRVDYVEGNRDFFLAGSPYADAFDHVALEIPFEIETDDGGERHTERCLAVHGDGINDRDWQYRFWCRLSKSPPARAAILGLPSGMARRFVRGTEARLSQTNFKHKRRIPEGPIRAYGARRLAEGYDRLYLGHFHEPRDFELAEGTVHVLDAWFRSRSVEWPGTYSPNSSA